MGKENYQLHMSFTRDFVDTYDLFMEMILFDKGIKNSVPEVTLKKGLFSPAVRHLIVEYVSKGKDSFLNFKRSKIYEEKKKEVLEEIYGKKKVKKKDA